MENYFEDVCKILDKLTDNRQKSFKMNLRTKLYMSGLMNNYRGDIIARQPPDAAIKIPGVVAGLINITY